ncbi:MULTISPECIES: competence protein CoiA [unclassified Ligilactobacillus]|uniref:competence protein CoiA n=1 Tax=unclassified Ligilactobacillus TaxID=2767920 RepID=UPI0038526AF0
MNWAYDNQHRLITASQAQPKQPYWCPRCGVSLHVRRGRVNRAYFAHQARSTGVGRGETTQHASGKQQLVTLVRQAGYPAVLERSLPASHQRPDILVGRWALEYQCAPLSVEAYCHRMQGYQQAGVFVLWLLGSRYTLRRTLSRQVAQFLRWRPQLGWYLTYYDVSRQRLGVAYDLWQAPFLPLRVRWFWTKRWDEFVTFMRTPRTLPVPVVPATAIIHQQRQLNWRCQQPGWWLRRLQVQCYQAGVPLTMLGAFIGQTYAAPLYQHGGLEWRVAVALQWLGRPQLSVRLRVWPGITGAQEAMAADYQRLLTALSQCTNSPLIGRIKAKK